MNRSQICSGVLILTVLGISTAYGQESLPVPSNETTFQLSEEVQEFTEAEELESLVVNELLQIVGDFHDRKTVRVKVLSTLANMKLAERNQQHVVTALMRIARDKRNNFSDIRLLVLDTLGSMMPQQGAGVIQSGGQLLTPGESSSDQPLNPLNDPGLNDGPPNNSGLNDPTFNDPGLEIPDPNDRSNPQTPNENGKNKPS